MIADYSNIEDIIGNTPLVCLKRIPGLLNLNRGNIFLAKLEGNNPAGSIKDRCVFSMIKYAEIRKEIMPGDTLIEATSGNTGIALAMIAAIRGYKMILIMPKNLSIERRSVMTAYGAKIILVSESKGGMEYARDLSMEMELKGVGKVLNQFSNIDNPRAHFEKTGPEIWEQTQGNITHFISAMGTTGTVMGVGSYLKSRNKEIQIIGVQPEEGSQIPGIRRWSKDYLPSFFNKDLIDSYEFVNQDQAEKMARRLACEEGIFAGISSAGSLIAALRIAEKLENSIIVFIICDRGDRYLSTGVF